MVLRPVPFGQQSCVRQFVERFFFKTDGKRFHRMSALLRHQSDDRGRIDPAAQKRAKGNIGYHSQPDRLAQALQKLRFNFFLRGAGLPGKRWFPVALRLHVAFEVARQVFSRPQSPDSLECGERTGHELIRQILVNGVVLRRNGYIRVRGERLDLGTEQKRLRSHVEAERVLLQTVTVTKKNFPALTPLRKSK